MSDEYLEGITRRARCPICGLLACKHGPEAMASAEPPMTVHTNWRSCMCPDCETFRINQPDDNQRPAAVSGEDNRSDGIVERLKKAAMPDQTGYRHSLADLLIDAASEIEYLRHGRDVCSLQAAVSGEGESDIDKRRRNQRVQSRYDDLMREGKHGHYETLFRVVREEIERAAVTRNPGAAVDIEDCDGDLAEIEGIAACRAEVTTLGAALAERLAKDADEFDKQGWYAEADNARDAAAVLHTHPSPASIRNGALEEAAQVAEEAPMPATRPQIARAIRALTVAGDAKLEKLKHEIDTLDDPAPPAGLDG